MVVPVRALIAVGSGLVSLVWMIMLWFGSLTARHSKALWIYV
jgi:hypothetical protein